jgi:hypothetical protein
MPELHINFSSKPIICIKQINMREGTMRYFIFIIILFTLTAIASAQEETLIKDDGEKGGFGGPVVKYTTIYDQSALLIGGRGGWIMNHSLVLGGGGYAIVNEIDTAAGALPGEGPLDIKFGYGGFEMEYIFNSMSLTHFSLYALFGAGDIHYVKDEGSVSESNHTTGESDFVFVVEPAINAELNIVKWFRVDAGVSYRLVMDVNQVGLNSGDFSGLTAIITFKFGNFLKKPVLQQKETVPSNQI